MRIYITGINGQVGSAIAKQLGDDNCMGGHRPDLDITDLASTRRAIGDAEPELVIHCAAMTDVDGCARDPERANLVNGTGSRNVARCCAEFGAAMVLLSSNEIFNGNKSEPYIESDAPGPINPYGQSKLAAEQHCRELVERCFIVRSSWLYAHGGSNFIHRIQALARGGKPLSVVDDELGAPTSVDDLASAIIQLIKTEHYGNYHLVNEGHTSRLGLARAVLDQCGHADTPIRAMRLADFKRASTPPRNGALANTAATALGVQLRPWQTALQAFLQAR